MGFKRLLCVWFTWSAFTCNLFGVALSLEELSAYPRSLAKDYYIYRYLTENNPSPQEAWELLGQAHRMSNTLLYAFGDTIKEPGFQEAVACLRMNQEAFLKATLQCQAIRANPFLIASLAKPEQERIKTRLQKAYPEYFTWLDPLLAASPHQAMLENEATHFLFLYTSVGENFRKNTLNHPLSVDTLVFLSAHPLFQSFITQVVFERVHTHVAVSLLELSPQNAPALSSQSAFLLGINALEHERKTLAKAWFDASFEKAFSRQDKDRALFWNYLLTTQPTYLEALAESFEPNIYTLAARELLGKEGFVVATPSPTAPALENYSITDPLTWRFTLEHLRTMDTEALETFSQRFYTQETLPHYAFAQERLHRFQTPHFITPYAEHLTGMSPERKALILAIARQESRFIPAAISTSYALGMMQFMPFLARDIAKKEKMENFDIDMMFQPHIAYRFASIHLDYLESWLYHPLFVAYAYNGGIGFTRRTLQRGDLFNKGPYEPFLSMELVPYAESREYGKKVLTNYVIYGRLEGLNLSIWDLFETLSEPAATDRFRSAQ